MAYKSLREKSRYLKELGIGSNRTLKPEEITECENYADTTIEGILGKSWAAGSVPLLVEHIADLLGSSKAFDFLHSGQAPKESEYGEHLEKKAMQLLERISSGKMALKLPDGTWDEDYGMSRESKEPGGLEILI